MDPLRRAPPALRRLLLIALLLSGGCSTVRYLAGQGLGQLQLLRERRRVSDVIADPATPPRVRERLRLVMAAREFGVRVLGLRGGAEFTRYIDTGGPVAYNLTAAEQTRLVARTWDFPLIGRVPYLGYFHKDAAVAAARRFQKEGLDVYVRPVGAYSTLGYLLSPIYASMIDQPGEAGEVRAVETILHEMAHTTAWLGSASDLNESFATVVGVRGAALFFRRCGAGKDAAPGALAQRDAQEDEQRNREFTAWLRGAMRDLEAFYRRAADEGWPRERLLRERQARFAAIQQSYRDAFPPPRYSVLARGPINNAVLLSFGVYQLGSDGSKRQGPGGGQIQRELLAAVGGDLAAYIALYRRATQRQDGAAWLRGLAAEYRRTGSISGL